MLAISTRTFMTSTFRATVFSSLSSLGLLVVAAPALAQEPAPAAPAETPPAEAPAAVEPAAAPEAAPAPAPEPEPAPAPAAVVVVEEPVVEKAPEPVAPAAEPEPSLSPLKIGTSSFSRFEFRENYDELGVVPAGNAARARFSEGDTTVFRARLTFQTAELDLAGIKGSIYFAPQASGSWGTSGTGGTIGEANVGIYEGYFKLAGDQVAFKAGRFAMNYGDALVIGNLDWHQAGRAFDGAMVSVKAGKANIDAFVTQTAQGWPTQGKPFLGGDAFFWGAYAALGPAIAENFDLDFYALGKSWGAANTSVDDGAGGTVTTHQDAATFVTLGARAKQKIGVFDYRAEAGVQVGKTQAAAGDALKKLAYQGDLELGVAPVKAFRIALGALFASGNSPDSADKDEAYDELYPTTHKWMGQMDIIGTRTNVMSALVKAQINFTESFGLNVEGDLFIRPEAGGLGRVDNDTATPGVQNDNNYAGFLVNAGLAKKWGKAAQVRGLYGIFVPGKDHYASNESAHYLEIEAGLRF